MRKLLEKITEIVKGKKPIAKPVKKEKIEKKARPLAKTAKPKQSVEKNFFALSGFKSC